VYFLKISEYLLPYVIGGLWKIKKLEFEIASNGIMTVVNLVKVSAKVFILKQGGQEKDRHGDA
jgi:hypothetical protein